MEAAAETSVGEREGFVEVDGFGHDIGYLEGEDSNGLFGGRYGCRGRKPLFVVRVTGVGWRIWGFENCWVYGR